MLPYPIAPECGTPAERKRSRISRHRTVCAARGLCRRLFASDDLPVAVTETRPPSGAPRKGRPGSVPPRKRAAAVHSGARQREAVRPAPASSGGSSRRSGRRGRGPVFHPREQSGRAATETAPVHGKRPAVFFCIKAPSGIPGRVPPDKLHRRPCRHGKKKTRPFGQASSF